ncbi:MAG: UDP-N-acetylmuramoyl-L-alanine--D-glutamate ligase [Chloroflexi bacterium]|nr:UDP-N-acetylmuramoyl-L-alanine--D-glutamate ligase [Chloroflexota bacterium]
MTHHYMNRRVVILGAARQGKALAHYMALHGAHVTLNDAQARERVDLSDLADVAGITTVFGGHPLELLDDCDLLCLSGGVPIDLPIVLEARRRGVALSNDAQIFFEQCPAPIIGITGSAGKTTTTTLIGEMLRRHVAAPGPGSTATVWVGGNIGNPLIRDVELMRSGDFAVMELSSFQLELMTYSPHLACVTNVTPNHLDRHGTMEAYTAAKKHILDFQTANDVRVLCADDAVTRTLAADVRNHVRTIWFSIEQEPAGEGAWLDEGGMLRVRIGALDGAICHRCELQLMGAHNILNVLAAAAVCAVAGVGIDVLRAVAVEFRGVAHRLQMLGEINGARYYDDSIATAPERLMAGLRAFESPVLLLCGGRDKYLPWEDAAALMHARCRHIVLFGEMAPMVAGVLERVAASLGTAPRVQWTIVPHLADAFAFARCIAGTGDVVLLSPGGTSFDEFKDFAERGNAFAALVRTNA